jgi:hypothetical protein
MWSLAVGTDEANRDRPRFTRLKFTGPDTHTESWHFGLGHARIQPAPARTHNPTNGGLAMSSNRECHVLKTVGPSRGAEDLNTRRLCDSLLSQQEVGCDDSARASLFLVACPVWVAVSSGYPLGLL